MPPVYRAINSCYLIPQSPYASDLQPDPNTNLHMATFTQYLWSIIYMPSSLRILCLTNLFCWMSLVCFSLYFTDFVGEAVFGGDPSVRNSSTCKGP